MERGLNAAIHSYSRFPDKTAQRKTVMRHVTRADLILFTVHVDTLRNISINIFTRFPCSGEKKKEKEKHEREREKFTNFIVT